jgi:hypothetical protein
MSQQDVDLVTSLFAGGPGGDELDMAAALVDQEWIISMGFYLDVAQAREAAGLS